MGGINKQVTGSKTDFKPLPLFDAKTFSESIELPSKKIFIVSGAVPKNINGIKCTECNRFLSDLAPRLLISDLEILNKKCNLHIIDLMYEYDNYIKGNIPKENKPKYKRRLKKNKLTGEREYNLNVIFN